MTEITQFTDEKNLRRFERSTEEEKSPADDTDYRRKINGGKQQDRQEIKEESFTTDCTDYRNEKSAKICEISGR